jgi:hypothetical protein
MSEQCADVLSVNYAQEYRTHGAYVRPLRWALGGLRRHDFGALFTPAKSFRRNATEDDSATRRRLVNKIKDCLFANREEILKQIRAILRLCA